MTRASNPAAVGVASRRRARSQVGGGLDRGRRSARVVGERHLQVRGDERHARARGRGRPRRSRRPSSRCERLPMNRTGSIASRVPPARHDDVPAGEVRRRRPGATSGGRAAGSGGADRAARRRPRRPRRRSPAAPRAGRRRTARTRAARSSGSHDRVAEAVAQPGDVGLRRRVGPHVAVHRRRDDDRRRRREAGGGHDVAREPVGHRAEPVRGRRRDDDRVGRCRRPRCARSGRRAAGRARRSRPGGATARANESGPTNRVADGVSITDDVGALGAQEPEQLDGLVGRDRAGDAEADEAAVEPAAHDEPELERLAAGDLGVEDREALERQVRVDGVDALEARGPRRGRQAAGQDRADVGRARRRSPRRARRRIRASRPAASAW